MSRTKSRIAAPPPELGQHTNEVLKEFGFKPKEIAALRKQALMATFMAGMSGIRFLQARDAGQSG